MVKKKKTHAKKGKAVRPAGGSKKGPSTRKKSIRVKLNDGSTVTSQLVDELPKNPVKGRYYSIVRDNHRIGRRQRLTAEATGKKGFGKWKFKRNEKVKDIPKSKSN